MTEKAKKVNYTPEMVADMVTVYGAATDEFSRDAAMDSLATKYGKTVASIRSKLSFEGVYQAKAKATPKGTNAVKKADMVTAIAEFANDDSLSFDSLENANRTVLNYVIDLQMANIALEAELFSLQDVPVEDEVSS